MHSPLEIARNYVEVGVHKSHLSIIKMVLLGFFAGMFIGFAGIASTTASSTIAAASVAKQNASYKRLRHRQIRSRFSGIDNGLCQCPAKQIRGMSVHNKECDEGSSKEISDIYKEPVFQHFPNSNFLLQYRQYDQVIAGEKFTACHQYHSHTRWKYRSAYQLRHRCDADGAGCLWQYW